MPTLLDAAGAEVPALCTGKSLVPILKGETDSVRDVLHGEHAGQYDYQDGHHFLVSERYKYIWYSQRGTEHLFDLADDPYEQVDLALRPGADAQLASWRSRLVEVLKDRPEGFVDRGGWWSVGPTNRLFPDTSRTGFMLFYEAARRSWKLNFTAIAVANMFNSRRGTA